MKPLTPFHTVNNIPVVFASDENFVPYTGVAIHSLLEQIRSDCYYDIVILCGKPFDARTSGKLYQLVEGRPRVSLRIIDVSSLVAPWQDHCHWGNLSIATYYRFLIAQLFTGYGKVLYLDGDILVRHDVKELFDVQLPPGCALAAAPDTSPFIGTDESREEFKQYALNTLKLKDRFKYFNAGVMLWDVPSILQQDLPRVFLDKLKEIKKPTLHDQDILNASLNSSIALLHLRFNFFHRTDGLDNPPDNPACRRYIQQRREAAQDPVIIHYAGWIKPWFYPHTPWAQEWWSQARNTPFYDEIRARLNAHDQKLRRQKRRLLLDKPLYRMYKTAAIITGKEKYKSRMRALKEAMQALNMLYKIRFGK